jgi:phosphopantothenoylcysteine decarboxylase / phosphopantothenate---cysteine ligase
MRRFFSGKEIVLGVTGSIAAYKACEIASRLVELEAKVTAALTRSATELVGAATFEGITGRRAITRMFEPLQSSEIEHIAVATRADVFIIAPATANFLAKMAHGLADDWLSTTLLVTRAPVLVAPAMNSNMYAHPATQANVNLLRERGCHVVGPDAGRLACGTVGPGRLIDPMAVVEAMVPLMGSPQTLAGKHVLMTTGGNREAIDPVRFIGNRSSGAMGRALALEALARGARVTAVAGPSDVPLPHGVEVVPVESAQQMADAVMARLPGADCFVGAAAVADYRVGKTHEVKHKRNGLPPDLALVENVDIIHEVSRRRHPGLVVVGFAAETDDLIAHAHEKLRKKGLDLIIANQIGAADSTFGTETTRAAILNGKGAIEEPALMTKDALAEKLFEHVEV